MSKTPFYRTKTFSFIVGLSVTAICFWFVWRMIQGESTEVMERFRNAHYGTLPLIFLTLFVFYWLKAWRWRLLLLPVGTYHPLRDLFPPIMMGFAFNNVLPARLGEVVRCVVFSRQHNLGITVTVSSVVLERIFDAITIFCLFGVGLFFIEGVDPAIRTSAYVAAGAAAVCVVGGLVYLLWTKPFVAVFEAILKRVPFCPHGLVDKVCRMLEAGAEGLSALRDVRLVLAILFLSMIQWVLNGILIYIALWSFDISVPATVALVLLGVVAFGVAVPSSPGYFGVIQFCFMAVLKLFVDDQPAVFASSIYFHLSQWVPVTAIGMFYFFQTGFSIRQVEAEEETLEEAKLAAPQ